MWNEIILIFRNYIGNGLAAGLFLVAFLYLFFMEKDRTKRIILLYLSAVVMLFFFFPFFAGMYYRYMDAETYYRIIWLVPMTAVIAYAGTKLVADISKKSLKGLAALIFCAVIVLTGDYVYDNPYFSAAENRFHVPQTVALVCDAIIVEGREVRAVFPDEMLPFVRQYTDNVCMPYGREMQVERWWNNNLLYDAMQEAEPDCEKIALLAEEQECHYIIMHETKLGREGFKGTDYSYVETVAGYCIYLRNGAYLGIDF